MVDSKEFTWGVATSAYQIEGGSESRGRSIWDRFAAVEGNIADGTSGEIATDHFRRYREDVSLMKDLGVDAYRFSTAWPRVIPDGVGRVSQDGLDFYDRLVDELLSAGIDPWVTLYHWDLPLPLEERGGWPNRSTAEAFADYTDAVTKRLGDRVKNWITINEPWVAAFLGYLEGIHAPGRKSWRDALAAAHHLLLAHGRAVPVIRSNVASARVGIALDCRPVEPASPSMADTMATRHFDGFRNRWFFDPIFGRGYPEDMVAAYRARGRIDRDGIGFEHALDQEEIATEIDFLGINYYTSLTVTPGAEERDEPEHEPGPDPEPGFTEMGWRNTPWALSRFLERVQRRYAPNEIVITENGASYTDVPDTDDWRRVEYLGTHIEALRHSAKKGVPVAGYFVWSLMDNFEWGLGYTQRFGLVSVDRETLERKPRQSFRWYRDQIRASRA